LGFFSLLLPTVQTQGFSGALHAFCEIDISTLRNAELQNIALSIKIWITSYTISCQIPKLANSCHDVPAGFEAAAESRPRRIG